MNADYCKSMKLGLVDDTGIIKLEFIQNSKYPQILADEMSKGAPKLSSTQARSFYNTVNKVYLDVIANTLSMNEAMVELTMLSSRVKDKFNKGSVPAEFKEFIEMNVDAVHDISTLKAFILHFEAICNNLKDVSKSGNNNAGRGNTGHNGAPRGNTGYNNTPHKLGGYKNDNKQGYGGKR